MNHIIAVGGTGQMIALAYLKLARLCGYKDRDIAEIHIVDSDDTGDTCTQIQKYLHKTEDALNEGAVAPVPTQENLGRFEEIFDDPPNNNIINKILPLLFTQKDLNVEVQNGMWGRPSVGSACMSIKTNPPGEILDPDILRLRVSVNQAGNKVVICGSLFGGTGAGAIPTLARFLRAGPDGDAINISIVCLLKWFSISSDENAGEGGKNYVDDTSLKQNSSAGVFYLKDKITQDVDACTILGPGDPVKREFEPVGMQKEKAYFINLLAAIITNNSLNATNLSDVFGPIREQKMYCYTTGNDDNGNQMLKAGSVDVFLPGGSNKTIKLHEIVEASMEVAEILGYLKNYIYSGYKSFSFTPSFTGPRWLLKAFDSNTNMEVYNLVVKKLNDLKVLIKWYNSLDNTGKGSQPFFSAEQNKIETSMGKYNKVKGNPMKFLRQWVNNIAGTSDGSTEEELVDLMVNELRERINKKFMENKFGNMYT